MAFPTNLINFGNTSLSTFTVQVNDFPLDPTFGVAGITVYKTLHRIPTAKLIITDGNAASQEFEASSSDLFVPGNEVTIMMGYHNNNKKVFSGIITAQKISTKEGQISVLEVTIKDKAVALTIGRKSRCFYNLSDKDIAKQIIDDYSDVQMGTGSLLDTGLGVTHKEMVQYDATDWDFIATRAEANGYLLEVEDGKISFLKPSSLDVPTLKLTYGINIYEFVAMMNSLEEYKNVKAVSWDDAKREPIEKESGAAPAVDNEGDLSGAELADVASPDDFILLHPGKISDKEAEAWAKAKMMRSRLSKITGHAKIEGFSGIKPGDVININKFSPRFNKMAFVSGVAHQITADSSWYTVIEFGFPQEGFTSKYDDVTNQPASGLLPGVNGLRIGIVMAIDQTDTDLRVKVQLQPEVDGDEGIWARFAGQYLGEKRGLFFRPEVDDEVVLGFLNDDPREPVILGSLNSANSKGAPPVEVGKDNDIKGIYTRSGIKIEINDKDQTILILTPEKNKIEIKDKESPSIVLEDQNKNKIEMSDKGITIESDSKMVLKAKEEITIEAPTISQTADTEFKAESSGTMNMEASGILTVKGSTVNINS